MRHASCYLANDFFYVTQNVRNTFSASVGTRCLTSTLPLGSRIAHSILVPPKSTPKRYKAKPQTATMQGGRTTQTFVTILHDCQTQQFFLFLEQELGQLFLQWLGDEQL